MKVKCKICTQYLQQIQVEARARDLRGLMVDGVNSRHKGNIERHAISSGLHDQAKRKCSFYQ